MPALIFCKKYASMTPSYSIADDREIIHFPLAGNGYLISLSWWCGTYDDVLVLDVLRMWSKTDFLDVWNIWIHDVSMLRFAPHRNIKFDAFASLGIEYWVSDPMWNLIFGCGFGFPHKNQIWWCSVVSDAALVVSKLNFSHRTKIDLVLLWNHRTEWGGFKCRQTETKLRFATSKFILNGFLMVLMEFDLRWFFNTKNRASSSASLLSRESANIFPIASIGKSN